MTKLKTNSSCKKRFSLTANGKVKFRNANKRHCMVKRSKRQIRNNRKSDYLFSGDAFLLIKSLIPNGLGKR